MNWKEPRLKFPCSQLSCALVEFCDEVLVETKRTALGMLEELRSCRVTLNQLRKVDAVEFVPSAEGGGVKGENKDIVRSTLDDPSAGAVKSFLMARISEYRAQVVSQYQTVVPREKASFEAAFDSFVEACLVKRQTSKESTKSDHRDGAGKGAHSSPDMNEICSNGKQGSQLVGNQQAASETVSSKMARNQWFEDQVKSGAGQPHLWKVFVVFQEQLRDACEAKSKEPLPPPLFSTLPKKETKSIPMSKEKKKKKRQRRQKSKSKSSNGLMGDMESAAEVAQPRGNAPDAKENRSHLPKMCGKKHFRQTSGESNDTVGLNKGKVESKPAITDKYIHQKLPAPTPWTEQHVAIIGPNGQFIPVGCTRA